MNFRLALAATLGFSLALAASCSNQRCDATSCPNGCCTADGACVSDQVDVACGQRGNLCVACVSGEVCQLGRCQVRTGGTGGGSGDGGNPDSGMGGGAGGGGGTGGGTGGGSTLRCSAVSPVCRDQHIQQLKLFATVNDAGVTAEPTDGGAFFQTLLDARGGGATPTLAFTYARFTSTKMEKVSLDDEAALLSADWDIAVRRFVLRTNSGISGASCVESARVPPGTTFEALTKVPANLTWRTEQYLTGAMCEFVPDTSGIGAPATALGSYWTYQSCVQMTGNVFVLHLRDGRYVKLQVLGYYDPGPQATCNATGQVPMPSGAGNVRIRWAYVDAP